MGLITFLASRLGLAATQPPAEDPTGQLAALKKENAWLAEQIRAYGSANLRLTPFFENLTGETPEIRSTYRQVLKEPTVKAALLGKIFAVSQLDLQMAAGDKTPWGQNIANFNRDNIAKSKGGTRHVVESMLFGALLDGYSVSEKVRAPAERGKWKGKVVLKHLKSKDTQYSAGMAGLGVFTPGASGWGRVQITVDEFKNVVGIYAGSPNEGEEFNPNDFVVFTYLKLFESPLGMSDMRAINRASSCKEAAIKLRMIFLDKYTGPYLVGKHNNETTKLFMEAAFKKARAAGYISIPEGSEVEVINLAMSGTADFKSAIDDFDREILIGIQGAFLHIFEGQVADGRGDTSIHKGQSDLFVWYLAQLCADAINEQIVPDFTDLNFPGKPELPTASLGGVDPAAVVAELGVGEKLRSNGVPTSADQWYEKSQWVAPLTPADAIAGLVDPNSPEAKAAQVAAGLPGAGPLAGLALAPPEPFAEPPPAIAGGNGAAPAAAPFAPAGAA